MSDFSTVIIWLTLIGVAELIAFGLGHSLGCDATKRMAVEAGEFEFEEIRYRVVEPQPVIRNWKGAQDE